MKKPLIILFLLLFAGLCQATLITRVKETERFKTYKEDDDLVKFLRNLVIWNEDMYAALAGRINWLIDRDEFRGDIKLIGDEKKVYWYNGDYYLTIVAPSGLSANYALTWPLNDGDTGQAVITDGSGVLSFSTPAGMGDMLKSTYDSNEDGVVAVPAGGLGVGTLTDGGVLLGSGTGAITPMAVLEDGEIIVGDGTTDPVAESGATARTSLGLGTGNSPQFAGLSFNTNPSVVSSSYKIQVKPNSDNTDYIEFSTTSSTPSISAEGGSSPNLKITASGGTIDFDDENFTTEGKMTAGGFDGIVGGTTPAAGTFTTLVVDSPTLVVNASGYTDKVGIGTSSPDSVFHIKAGTPGTVGSHPAGQLIIQNPADTVFATAVITGYESDGDGNPDQQLWYLGSSSSSNSDIIFLNRRNSKLALGTNGSHRITILGNGNVGINTTTPASKLSINGGLHVGGDSDAGDNNVLVDGSLTTTNLTATGVITVKTKGTASFLVAASDAPADVKAIADYVCDGTDDDSEIEAAMAALSNGGTITLSEGTFYTTNSDLVYPSNDITLKGQGWSTIIECAPTANENRYIVDMGAYNRNVIRDLKINGKNDASMTTNDYFGIRIDSGAESCRIINIWIVNLNPTGTANDNKKDGIHCEPVADAYGPTDIVIERCRIQNIGDDGLDINMIQRSRIVNNYITLCNDNGIDTEGAYMNTFSGNIFHTILGHGLELEQEYTSTIDVSSYNTVIGNTFYDAGNVANKAAIYLNCGAHNTVIGNTINTAVAGIRLDNQKDEDSNYNVITGNRIENVTNGIQENVDDADYNRISGNVITNASGADYVIRGANTRVAGPRASFHWFDNTVGSANSYFNTAGGDAFTGSATRGWTMPRDGCVVSNSIQIQFTTEDTDPCSVTIEVHKNGADLGCDIALTSADETVVAEDYTDYATFTFGTYEFSAGDNLSIYATEVGVWVWDDTSGILEVQYYD